VCYTKNDKKHKTVKGAFEVKIKLLKINVKFDLKNNKLSYEYRKAIISFYKNILSKYNNGEWKNVFYKNKNPIQKEFAYSFYLPGAKFLKNEIITLEHNFFYLNISTYNYETGILLYNAMLNQRETEFPLAFENTMKIKRINFQPDKSFNNSNIKIKMLSPLCVRQHNKKTNKDDYLTFEDEDFVDTIKKSIEYRTKDIHEIKPWMIENLEINFDKEKVKKIITTHYGVKFPVTIGSLCLKGHPDLLNYLHYAGIGSRTSSGFGHFKIV